MSDRERENSMILFNDDEESDDFDEFENKTTTTKKKKKKEHAVLFPICAANEDEILAQRTAFPIKEEKLIRLAKRFYNGLEHLAKNELETYLSDDFEYWGPILGQTSKKQFLRFLEKQQLYRAFPNHRKRTFGWTVDLFEPNRVWFIHRIIGTHTESLGNIKPTYREMELPPTSISITFNVKGLVTKYTSFVIDRSVGDSHGYGGMMGIFAAIGGIDDFEKSIASTLCNAEQKNIYHLPMQNNRRKQKIGLCFKLRAFFFARRIARQVNKRTKLETKTTASTTAFTASLS
jgi:hypothetical protein